MKNQRPVAPLRACLIANSELVVVKGVYTSIHVKDGMLSTQISSKYVCCTGSQPVRHGNTKVS